MNVSDDPAVRNWVTRLQKLGVLVPPELNHLTMTELLKTIPAHSPEQKVAVHLAWHVHAAERCDKTRSLDDPTHSAT